ncbi:MAG: transketolase [Candidatus Eisenbacteria bacterium]|nr:transketolase [Candidatus Eisenbacteria bacterium]
MMDQCIDMMLNYRQSGHPGGSRSKVHAMVSLLLGDVMRWDIRRPELRFGDRFILSAGHTAPLLYATLAVLAEPLRIKYEETSDERYRLDPERIVFWEDLMMFRRNKGLPGHAEMEGKTLFVKANTGPSGHGSPFAAGAALALKRAGAEGVRVFAMEGEGGLTPGSVHETMNSAWGLGLDNLCYIVDWNDFGIDSHRVSDVVPGTPSEWFSTHGWRVFGAENGSDWPQVSKALIEMVHGDNPEKAPSCAWMKTRKGRGYLKYDYASHGAPHKPANNELYWKTKQEFMEKYDIEFDGYGQPRPEDDRAFAEQVKTNLRKVFEVMRRDTELVDYMSEKLVSLGESVPDEIPSFRLGGPTTPFDDPVMTDFENYPEEMWAKPGDKKPNRAALAKWGSWANAYSKQKHGQPVFIASSADLADSTNISGFAHDFDGMPGWDKYERSTNPEGTLLPQEITEFANAGMMCGMATVNLSKDPYHSFNGFYGACSTYGSFVYLKYGLMRLFSQLAQDTEFKTGKILWVAGHSGPETADDSRTHFGIFAPGVTQLFPEGQVLDVHPWEYNEVPVVIAACLAADVPITALHLTRPPVEIPDRQALGIPSHFEAAKGAYVLRPFREGRKPMGTVFVQGTSTTSNLIKILPELDKNGLNVKVVAAISPQLLRRQPAKVREAIVSDADWFDSMGITNRARRLLTDWIVNPISMEYTLSSDWDDRWRTGGTLDEVIEEAHLSPEHLLQGIERFVRERDERLAAVQRLCEAAGKR